MATVLSFSIPFGVLLLLAVGFYESRSRQRSRRTMSGTYIDQISALLYPTKRMELDHRDSSSMLRDDEAQGAPPPVDLDFEHGTAVLRRK